MRPTSLDGVDVPYRAEIVVLVAAANRDPDVFESPHQLQPGRRGNNAITFGLGPHVCPGASLARLVTRIVVHSFAARYPDATLDGPVPQQANAVLRGPLRLPVSLRAGAKRTHSLA